MIQVKQTVRFFEPGQSTAVFDQKIMNDLLHKLELRLPGFVDPNPQASLEGPIQIFGDVQF
jgi:hypothetical protein